VRESAAIRIADLRARLSASEQERDEEHREKMNYMGWYYDQVALTRAAEARVEAAEQALAYIEWCWNGVEDACPSCGMLKHRGHDYSCRTAAALAGREETGGG
jgi:hypothetical protein